MLTVKHITISGEEYVFPTTHINYVPADRNSTSPAVQSESFWRYDRDGRSHEMHGGTVFVMNELGKTVSRYDLGVSNVPIGDVAPESLGQQI